nr:RNA-directed DNA polymerase, eukaryota, reverse transcriptase zinc-binding domain protein [Tanacetum cinerariifolium]
MIRMPMQMNPHVLGILRNLMDLKLRCWGNFNFDYVYSEAVGQSGEILSVLDPNKFQKLNHTISDYCTLVRGVWVPNDIEKTEAIEVAQKAKIKWAVEGDENSKYYHGFDTEFPNKICFKQDFDLEREVSKEENLIECDVVKAVKWFFLHERIPSEGNSSFITLIPKVANVNMVKDFRPISLIDGVSGKTCWVRAIEVPKWVLDFEDDCDDDDFESNDGTQVAEGPRESVGKCSDLEGESDSEAIPETRFNDEPMDKVDDINSIPHSKPQSEDSFGVYELLNKKKKVTNNEGESQNSPTYPLGFTRDDNAEENINTSNVDPVERSHNGDKEKGEFVVLQNQNRNDTDADVNESTCSGHFKKSNGPRTGESIIQLIEDLVNVGQTMGYDMTRCMKNMENIT